MASDERSTTRIAMVGPGRVLRGRYELVSTLGSGGMAVVFLARDRVLDRDVAVKVLREQHATDPVFLARFTREASHAARLSHPGLVTIFDSGIDQGTAFIVMEAVRGRTLREVLATEGPLDVGRAVAIAADVCGVLEVAHRAGVVHRDIKPGNVLICEDGRTRVFDFGIARTDGSDALTQTATVIGTAAYISPEQAAGAPAGPQSDLYALGCVLWEMLTGSPPFSAETPVALLYQHVNDDLASLSAQRPHVSSELDAVVRRLLAKDPAGRPATAALARQDLLAALRPAGGDTRVRPAVPPADVARRRARPLARWAAIGAGVLAASLALGLGLARQQQNPVPVAGRAPSAASGPSTTPASSAPVAPPVAPSVTPSAVPVPLTVPTAATAPGALDALRSVVAAGQAAALIDPAAVTALLDAADDVGAALDKGKSANPRVRGLADLVDSLASSGQLAGGVVGPLHGAVDQLRLLVEASQ
jgi:tRNA A-37 threonylcarbamoyl transferase component Bud32